MNATNNADTRQKIILYLGIGYFLVLTLLGIIL